MWIVSMRMKIEASDEETERKSREGFEKFRALEGLTQKYYIRNHETGELGGVYLFETKEAVDAYVNGPIVASVAERFGVIGEVKLEVVEVLMTLDD
ncbi:YdhR family protein [Rhodococcus sp. IEGM 1379]|uniref:YdhR family protein n=1 Tax=Rhodococcus sp. IEGM 1379 TaxID=3047086 RepID=UPI0024B6F83F|nr:YdhR family protein [Rhodococcus sp. IEGM 1379]MDI9914189.1 YdhR family protein [Rhodococcus sp. IEGM 1379]